MNPTVSIVLPVYNEADFIPQALPMLISEMEGLAMSYRIHLVENGSSDGSAEVARVVAGEAPVTVTSLAVADYGSAMRQGFLEAEGDWVVNFDIDYFSADFLRQVMATPDADLVIGSKRTPGSLDRRPPIRRFATWVFNLLLRTILGSKVSDTHGMKAFRRSLVEDLADQVVSRQDLYDTELVIRAEREGYRIVEVPVVVEEIRAARSSLVRRVPRTVLGLLRIRRTLRNQGPTRSSSA
ncbi:MAG TPA: glycosyltransferase family 2 protein [Acidimicrobiia bacterium]|nr:glycosyltransferase family 2 protein [Acidimicrobiia bacterium]